MIQRILRSPLVGAGFLVFFLFSFNEEKMPREFVFGFLAVVAIVELVLAWIHNRKSPNDKIEGSWFIPLELNEVDEGQQWITYKACRNVYVYYSWALPMGAVMCFYIADNPFALLVCFGIIGVGQYIVYWLTTSRILHRI
ncbi:hypothetical protein [Priestia taiwanensis]|uniref:Uncharacterized protein n=1 Tax=Priestia taiwanensis TaxID=1347902 RepID=A0A917ELX7_9BACI|nr:hypothetical protein [Priestia taiwanensis]MBM7362139.1 hypothetical protein [Priestia taiwanensis]GGE59767.1 hypothetical protein GCM10007140_07620 [Priestia taiwanensis]